jgi:pyridoxal 5'-phosphate synthase pdxT subunit
MMYTIGILALQGAFKEHSDMVKSLGHTPVEVRTPEQLKTLDAIILPGGESTAIGKLLRYSMLLHPLKDCILKGLPVWGTCAGMILLAEAIDESEDSHIGTMTIRVKRNAYGRQLDSFSSTEIIHEVSETALPLVFIRSPYILDCGPEVEVIHKSHGDIVAAKQSNMLVTSFHPELTDDNRFHQYFIQKFVKPFKTGLNIAKSL